MSYLAFHISKGGAMDKPHDWNRPFYLRKPAAYRHTPFAAGVGAGPFGGGGDFGGA